MLVCHDAVVVRQVRAEAGEQCRHRLICRSRACRLRGCLGGRVRAGAVLHPPRGGGAVGVDGAADGCLRLADCRWRMPVTAAGGSGWRSWRWRGVPPPLSARLDVDAAVAERRRPGAPRARAVRVGSVAAAADLVGGRSEDRLHARDGDPGCLCLQQRHEAGNVRRGHGRAVVGRRSCCRRPSSRSTSRGRRGTRSATRSWSRWRQHRSSRSRRRRSSRGTPPGRRRRVRAVSCRRHDDDAGGDRVRDGRAQRRRVRGAREAHVDDAGAVADGPVDARSNGGVRARAAALSTLTGSTGDVSATPAMPMPLFVLAAAMPETWVPWMLSSFGAAGRAGAREAVRADPPAPCRPGRGESA